MSLPTELPADLYGREHEAEVVREKEADEEFVPKKENVTGVNNIIDQLDATITIVLIFESAQYVSDIFCPSSGA